MRKLITLALVCAASLSVNAQLLNPGMEDWHDYTSEGVDLEAPDGWYGSDSVAIWAADYYSGGLLTLDKQLYKESSVVNGGSFSARIETKEDALLGVIPGVMANAQPQIDTANFDMSDPFGSLTYSGGAAVTERIAYVNAYVRYETQDPNGDEYGAMTVEAVQVGQGPNGSDLVVGTGTVSIFETPGTGFEGISALIAYTDENVVPDMIRIAFISTADQDIAMDGSVLYVDDVSMSPVSVINAEKAAAIKCYPNPVNDGFLNVRNAGKEKMNLNVFSATGQLVYSLSFTGSAQADLSALSNGMYFYKISDVTGAVIKNEKLILNK